MVANLNSENPSTRDGKVQDPKTSNVGARGGTQRPLIRPGARAERRAAVAWYVAFACVRLRRVPCRVLALCCRPREKAAETAGSKEP